jgi:FO synthase
LTDDTPVAWVVDPADAVDLIKAGVAPWRVTINDEAGRAAVLDALARTRAAFLRTRRSSVDAAVDLISLPGIDAVVSVFVDTVDDALDAIEAGARDLLLRDWDLERVGELRDALALPLAERTAIPIGVPIDEIRATLAGPVFSTYLNQVDASGCARPRHGWAPGRDEDPPVPAGRMSIEWLDAAWTSSAAPVELSAATRPVAAILRRALDGTRPSRDEVEILLSARGEDIDAIAWAADRVRRERSGDTITYVVNRNINYTNMCYFRCGFCAFSKGPRSLNLRGEPYLMGVEEVVGRSVEAWERGATEVCLQGGIHPEFTGDFYVSVLSGIKTALPDMHVHGFTPLEVWQGAETLGLSVREFLVMLRDAGLGTLPGTAAEILDDRVREHLCPDKIRTSQWAEVMITAHELGLKSTSTIMFGHIDDPASWANHFEVLRAVQQRTGGITEFVPLPFVHMGAPIYLRGAARPGPTWDEVLLIHAVARLAFMGLIDNIQASWVKLGLEGARRLLRAGCNDLGGTLMNEIISRSAGASHGQEMTPADFERLIVSLGRIPARRSTLYEILETAD